MPLQRRQWQLRHNKWKQQKRWVLDKKDPQDADADIVAELQI
jgi:hypothetical protein